MIFDKNKADELPEKLTNEELFKRQKHTLDLFPERNAISKEEYEKSLSVLKEKMKS